jgi:hypothetical protein
MLLQHLRELARRPTDTEALVLEAMLLRLMLVVELLGVPGSWLHVINGLPWVGHEVV